MPRGWRRPAKAIEGLIRKNEGSHIQFVALVVDDCPCFLRDDNTIDSQVWRKGFGQDYRIYRDIVRA